MGAVVPKTNKTGAVFENHRTRSATPTDRQH